MQLSWLILVLCCYLPHSESHPPSPSVSEWRQSRFIIDNRKNGLFAHNPVPYYPTKKLSTYRLSNETFKRRQHPIDRYQKDLSAEASIAEPNYYEKYNENSLPNKVIKGLQVEPKYQVKDLRNSTGVEENIVRYDDESGKIVTSTENEKVSEVLTWVPKLDQNVFVSVPSSSQGGSENGGQSFGSTSGYGTTSNVWEKTEEGNRIDEREKHVYETRIETVSYHQEVIFHPAKMGDNEKKPKWLENGGGRQTETSTYGLENRNGDATPGKSYREQSYDETEKNYGEPERSYGEPEKSYGEPERSYGEPERNYEEPERDYGEPERNYEEPERNYEEPEMNYEEPEKSYKEPVKTYKEPEINYEESDESYKEAEMSYEAPQTQEVPKDRSEEEANNNNNNKFSYVVEGSNFRKYRVEERTPDGFIVGEFGVVSHDDGSLRGVRYTADGTTNPQLIYETLIKFLSL